MYFQLSSRSTRKGARAAASRVEAKEPSASLLKGDVKGALAGGEPGHFPNRHGHARRHDHRRVRKDRHGVDRHRETSGDKRLFTEMVYQPMLELLVYLRQRFQDLHRLRWRRRIHAPSTEKVLEFRPSRLSAVAESLSLKCVMAKPTLIKLPEINSIDDKSGKPINIQQQIGRRPHCRLRQFRRRPADAPVDDCRHGPTLRPPRPSHRCCP